MLRDIDFFDDEDWDRVHRWRPPPCNELDRRGQHQDVHTEVYNSSGALIGTHFRCKVCNAVWNMYATSGDFPDKHDIHTK